MSFLQFSVRECVQKIDLQFPDGSNVTVSFEQLAQSKVLQNALDTADPANATAIELPVDVQYVKAWIGAEEVLAQDCPPAERAAECIVV